MRSLFRRQTSSSRSRTPSCSSLGSFLLVNNPKTKLFLRVMQILPLTVLLKLPQLPHQCRIVRSNSWVQLLTGPSKLWLGHLLESPLLCPTEERSGWSSSPQPLSYRCLNYLPYSLNSFFIIRLVIRSRFLPKTWMKSFRFLTRKIPINYCLYFFFHLVCLFISPCWRC